MHGASPSRQTCQQRCCEDLQGHGWHTLPSQGSWKRSSSLLYAFSIFCLQGCSSTGAQAVQSRSLPTAGLSLMELLRRWKKAGEVGKRVWCKPCRRVVLCCLTSASICCEQRTHRDLGLGRRGIRSSYLGTLGCHLISGSSGWCLVTAAVLCPLGYAATRDASHSARRHAAGGTWLARKISKCQLGGNVPPARSWVLSPISPDSNQITALQCLCFPLHSTKVNLYLMDF